MKSGIWTGDQGSQGRGERLCWKEVTSYDFALTCRPFIDAQGTCANACKVSLPKHKY